MAGIATVTFQQIESLSDIDLTALLRRLLFLECRSAGVAASAAHVALKITVPDGGEDGRVRWDGGLERTDWIPTRHCLFQVKATELGPVAFGDELVTKSKAKGTQKQTADDATGDTVDKQPLKPLIKQLLDSGGAYVAFYGRHLVGQGKDDRVTEMRKRIRAAGEPYADSCNLVIYDANDIASWVIAHLSAVVQVLAASGRPLPDGLETWETMSGYTDFQFPYVAGDATRDQQFAQVQDHLVAHTSAARIWGKPGLGKTRLAFEVLRSSVDESDSPDLAALTQAAVFLDAKEFGPDLVRQVQMWRQAGLKGLLVVDNCDSETHRRLDRECTHTASAMRLLTIGTESARDGFSLPFEVELQPVTDEVVERFLMGAYSSLTKVDLQFISTQLAQGYPQMAVLLAQARLYDVTDIQAILPHDLLLRLLQIESTESKTFEVARACAVFERVGMFDDVETEYRFIADIFRIEHDVFYREVQGLIKRGVLSRFNRFVQVRPLPLAWRLAADWWSGCSPQIGRDLVMTQMPGQLANALCERIRMLDELPAVRELVRNLCGDSGPFGQAEVLNSELGSQLFRALTEVEPAACVSCIERVFSDWSAARLRDEVGPGRRSLVSALENIAFWRTTFLNAARLLLRFAVAENEHWSNNATGVFLGHFKVRLSGTQASPELRLTIINEALAAADDASRALGVGALGAALEAHHFTKVSGPEQQGSRPPQDDWRPQIWQHVFDYWTECIQLLIGCMAEGGQVGELAIKELRGRIRGLFQYGRLSDIDKSLEGIYEATKGYSPETLDALQDALHYDSSQVPKEGREFLERWIDRFTPRTFAMQVRLFVTDAPWEHRQDEAGGTVDLAEQKARDLADVAVRRLDELIGLLPVLLRGGQRQVAAFGLRLGNVLEDPRAFLNASLEVLESIPQAERNWTLIGAVLQGVDKASAEVVEAVLQRVASTQTLRVHLVDLSCAAGLTVERLARIADKVKSGEVGVENLHSLLYGRATQRIPTAVLGELCVDLAVRSHIGGWMAVDLLHMHCLGNPEKWGEAAPFCKTILGMEGLLTSVEESRTSDLHHYKEVSTRLLKDERCPELARLITNEVVKLCGMTSFKYDLQYGLSPILDVLLAEYLPDVWDIVGQALISEERRSRRNVAHLLGQRGGSKTEKSTLSIVSSDFLIAWCDKYPERGPSAILELLPLYESEEGAGRFTGVVKRVLQRFGTSPAVFSAFTVNMWSFSWMGSMVPYYERQLSALVDLREGSHGELRNWLDKAIRSTRQSIEDEKGRDVEKEVRIY